MSVNLRTVYAFAREMYPKKANENINYGTAGFRGDAKKLEYVMYRMGLLATLRSRIKNGQVIGVMITASHNPEPDNGVKLIDPMGEMLESRWEEIATRLVNVSDQELESEVAKIINEENIDIGTHCNVYVGMDNRYHSPILLKAVSDGVIALKGNVREFGIITTPMMHYFVVCANTRGSYGLPTEEGYYKKLITAFESIRGNQPENGNYKNYLIFDGANGVGARKMLQFLKRMKGSLNCEVFNKGEGKINENCGADFVKVNQKVPIGLPNLIKANARCVSVDGDADRVVYFFTDSNAKFQLLDGDRIATLIADYLIGLVIKCGLKLKMGLIQTAYANGASTDYIVNQLKIPVSCVPTGVKHLHHKALEYDIGIYFEANGHGTIVFSDEAKEMIRNISVFSKSQEQKNTANNFIDVINLINETVGDAISDMLLVETILHSKGWDVTDWFNTYMDLPNKLVKIKVQNRNLLQTTDSERICIKPKGLQEEIDKIIANYKRGRAFVRPSGTEDFVRVYAEATTKSDVDQLAYEVSQAVFKMAGGIGSEPSLSEDIFYSHI